MVVPVELGEMLAQVRPPYTMCIYALHTAGNFQWEIFSLFTVYVKKNATNVPQQHLLAWRMCASFLPHFYAIPESALSCKVPQSLDYGAFSMKMWLVR